MLSGVCIWQSSSSSSHCLFFSLSLLPESSAPLGRVGVREEWEERLCEAIDWLCGSVLSTEICSFPLISHHHHHHSHCFFIVPQQLPDSGSLTHPLYLPCYLCSLSLLRLLLMLSALLMHFPSFLSFTFLSSFPFFLPLNALSPDYLITVQFSAANWASMAADNRRWLCVFFPFSPFLCLCVCVCHSRRIKDLATLLKCIAFSLSAWRGWLVGIGCD